ncbi:M23 family metallopeptidase [Streptomyces sp. NPDC048638]|uniref:M23 family metallopeptidase n=1 Tax=Streptomyces sp. NPDC048638 TaxID=3365580 RepID=UPI0037222BBB
MAQAAATGAPAAGGRPVTGPDATADRPSRHRLADVSLAVIRLGEAARRADRSYEERNRAALAERAEGVRLRGELVRVRKTAEVLRRRAGAIADAQYRTGSLVAYTRSVASGGRTPLRRQYEETVRRERALVARMDTARRAGRTLAADSALALARATALAADRDRLKEVRARADRGLRSARDTLRQLASQESRSGKCDSLSGEVTMAARAAVRASTQGTPWTRPVERYVLSAPFGGAGSHWASSHTGQDFAVPVGTPVRAVGGGRIASLTCGDGFGISLVVRHRNGLYTQYAHLSAPLVRPGQQVVPGERIALSGDTGNSTGPHLHFEVRRTPYLGSGVDPVPWLRHHGVRVPGVSASGGSAR